MTLFYYVVLVIALFIGVDAAWTGHWFIVFGAVAVILYFVINPYELS